MPRIAARMHPGEFDHGPSMIFHSDSSISRLITWQGIHTTSSLRSEQTVNVPPFADSIAEGDIK